MRLSKPAVGAGLVVVVLALQALLGNAAAATGVATTTGDTPYTRVLVVPTDFATIQAAVDAARAGDTIRVLPGTYREQVSIGKDLTMVGSGAAATTIRAPGALVPGESGANSIVEIHHSAEVAISRLAVSGPGPGTCDNQALNSGIRVLQGGHLDLWRARVTHIEDTPVAPCFRSGTGIVVGNPPPAPDTASATIRDSVIADYQGAGIVVINEGSTADITHNVIRGSDEVSTDGVEFVLGATGSVTRNLISNNDCRAGDPDCGRDFFTQLQHAGIAAEAGLHISGNTLARNQVGIYAVGGGTVHGNWFRNNSYFGVAFQDGAFTLRNARITGGFGGVAAVAFSADTTVLLDNVSIRGTSGPPTQTFEQDGFTASISTTVSS